MDRDTPALLDCAEALRDLVTCHADGGFVEPDPSVIDAALAALRALNGDDNAG